MAVTVPGTEGRPEALADVPGAARMAFTGAVVRVQADPLRPEGRIGDIGLGLVLDGARPSEASVLELGSGETRLLDLTREVVILDWVYDATLIHARGLAAEGRAARYGFRLAMEVLTRTGFGPLTRPAFLRIGFRDLCQDLDLHEGSSVRFVLANGPVARARLEPESACLEVLTDRESAALIVNEALASAFPLRTPERPTAPGAPMEVRLRFPLPLSLAEVRSLMGEVRTGFRRLLAALEPTRSVGVESALAAFGERDTLARFVDRVPHRWESGLAPRAARHVRTPSELRVH